MIDALKAMTDALKDAEPILIQTAEAIEEFDKELLHHLHWLKKTLANSDVVQAKAVAARLAKYISEAS